MNNDMGVIIAIIGVGVAMVGVVISMMFWSRQEANLLRAEAKEDRKDILGLIRSIEMEIKDFHARLEKQDAEFKAHIMHYHSNTNLNQ